jgi:hypothetical protein
MTVVRPPSDIYISADVETDGPIPGPYSMLSFALAVAGRFDGERFERVDPTEQTYYVELKPISENYQEEAMSVNQLDRRRLVTEGKDPTDAMASAARWVQTVAADHHPVLVAYPVAFDWSFLFWYFVRYCNDSPFGYSGCLDIRTLYQASARTTHALAGKSSMPAWLVPARPHTHNALDDAIEQAELFANVFDFVLSKRGEEARRRPAASG